MSAQGELKSAANGKRQGRDPALTWDIPPAVDAELRSQQSDACRPAFAAAGQAHVEAVVGQLLAAEGVEAAASWSPVLVRLAHAAAAALSPAALAASRNPDPRRHIKVKRLVGGGGVAEDSTVIQGVVCRKNVVHKRMRTFVEQPRVVALAGALEYQRSKNALSSFDSLIEPEKDYLKKAVDVIMELRPDVLLVERGVARYAQDLLLEAGVSVVINVKLQMLQRIAECTGGQVAASAEALRAQCVGDCEAFQVENLPHASAAAGDAGSEPSTPPAGASSAGVDQQLAVAAAVTVASASAPGAALQPLMIFRGCPRQVYATILLHDASAAELAKVKRVVAFGAYTAFWNSLEAALLADQLLAAGLCVDMTDVADAAVAIVRSSVAWTAEHRGTVSIVSASPHVSAYREPCQQEPQVAEQAGISSHPLARQASSDSDAWAVSAVSGRAGPSTSSGRASLSSGGDSERDGIATLDERDTEAASIVEPAAGSDIYHLQQLWLSISCRNPAKNVLCEAHHPHCMPFYREADLPLAAFIAAAAPANRKCPHPTCGDGAALHLRSFLHGDGLVTLSSVRLPSGKELPNGDEGAVWLWLRPLGSSSSSAPSIRCLQLSPDAACASFAHLLALLLDARHLMLAGFSLQRDFVRYLGTGPTVLCLHYTRITPFGVQLPPRTVQLWPDAESGWLQEEIKSVTEDADEAFSAVEEMLQAQAPLLDSAEPGASRAWHENFADTRSTFMEAVHATVALVDSKVTFRRDATAGSKHCNAAVEAVRALNRLRRMLAFVVQRWGDALAAGDLGARPCPTSIIEGLHEDKTVEREQQRRQNAATAPEQPHLVHRTTSGLISYAAPKLRAGAQEEVGEKPAGKVIQVGLVASLVKAFEGQRLAQTSTGVDAAGDLSSTPSAEPGVVIAEPPSTDAMDRLRTVASTESSSNGPLIVQQQSESAKPEVDDDLLQLVAKLGQLSQRLATTNAGQEVEQSPFARTTPATGLPPGVLASSQLELAGGAEDATPAANVAVQPQDNYVSRPALDLGKMPQFGGHRLGNILAGRSLLPSSGVGSFVTVYDNEPTSLVAYFLSSRQYQEYLNEATLASLAPAASGDNLHVISSPARLDCQMLAHDASPGQPTNHARFQMTAYYAPQFAALRRQCVDGGEAAYLASLSRCTKWDSQGGKSNAFFAKTRDDRYVIKQLSRVERQSFLGFAPDYFRYLSDALSLGRGTALTKILGVYQVSVHYPSPGKQPPFGGRDGFMDLLVMENLFYGRNIQRIYDLKGSTRDRYADESKAEIVGLPVLLDDNLRELHQTSPTLVAPEAYAHLQRALWADTGFLSTLDVMDYSLLVGFDRDRQELVVGVIDYIRQYSLDKQLESWVKKGMLGGKEPTIISPVQYSRRFRAAMLSYFVPVPGLTASADFDPAVV